MAEVVINDKVKTHEEGKHTYVGKYKGKSFTASMQDMNDDRELIYMEGEENFSGEEKDIIFGQLDEMTYISPGEDGDENSVVVENNYETWFEFRFQAFGSYGEHKFIVEEMDNEHGGDAVFIEGEENFSEEEQELIYEAVNEY